MSALPLFAPGGQRRLFVLCAVLALAFGARPERAAAQTDHGVTLVRADLLADTTAVVPGKPFYVGLRLKMAQHWHTYWLYSGDAGLPTKIDWQLPEGYKAGPIQWPLPEKIETPGDIINYGYDDEVVLLTEITPPAQPAGGEVVLKAKATWLVCAEKCIPGEAALTLKLPVGGDAQATDAEVRAKYSEGTSGRTWTNPPQAANAEIFAKYRALVPVPIDPARSKVSFEGGKLTFQLLGPDGQPDPALLPIGGNTAEFFPLPGDTAEVGHPINTTIHPISGVQVQDPSTAPGVAVATVAVTSDPKDADEVGGVWVVTSKDGKNTGFQVAPKKSATASNHTSAVPSPTPATVVASNSRPGGPQNPPSPGSPTGATTTPAGSIWHFLLLGFVGGLILNVMPCVLPVISLKLFSFVKQANEDRARVLRLGLAYAAGVFAWFLGFAGLVVGVKAAGGPQIGYSFQLQNPWFLLALIAISFVFSLNLLGVFEVILPGSITNAAGDVAGRREGLSGAFLQGVLATVLGSACTAPIFVDALSFAFSQSGGVILVMFASIAAGMSAPFVVLAAFPQWLRFLPRPGVWMERVKQGTGFLMLATVLWLLWTFGGNRRSPDAVVWAGALLLVLGVACWVQGAFNTLASSDRSRWAARGVIAVLVLGGGWFCVDQIVRAVPVSSQADGSFTAQLANAQKTGRPVFVDFTARWCAICQSNKKLIIAADPVQQAFRDHGVVFLEADYTAYSEDIAKLLQQFNAPSVPLYVIYPAGKPDAPVVLPTLLTQQAVLDGIAKADQIGGKPLAAR